MTCRRISIMLIAHVVVVAALGASCAPKPVPLDAIADGYVRAALQLAQHDRLLVEAWNGPDRYRPGSRIPVADILKSIVTLEQQLEEPATAKSTAGERARRTYLAAQLRALHFAGDRQMGRAAGIDEQARAEFGIDFPPVDASAIKTALADIDRLVPGKSPLADRVTALRRRNIIPADRKKAVVQIALDACRDAVARVIDLPADEHIDIQFRSGLEWDAIAHDAGGHHTLIEVNNDGALDVGRAYRLACHEGYAGHHAQHLLIAQLFADRRWPELQLMPAFGPHLLFIEGSAEVGADLALSIDQRIALYRERLAPAAGVDPDDAEALLRVDERLPSLLPVVTEVARLYLDGRISQQDAINRLVNEALVGDGPATLAFIERRRARALVYGEGRRAVYERAPSRSLIGLRDLFRASAALQ